MILKGCPFCGMISDTDWDDTRYPSYGWKDEDICGDGELVRHYVSVFDPDKHGMGYKISCDPGYGGCGAEMRGDSEEEVIAKWEKRID